MITPGWEQLRVYWLKLFQILKQWKLPEQMETQYNSNTLSTSTEVIYPNWQLLMPHQVQVLRDPHKFKVLVWHRRARKTTTALTEITKQALYRVGVYWYIFPTYGEAKDAVWRDPNMLFRIIPKDLIARTNESELVIYFKNGSILQLKGSDDPDALRGSGPVGIVLDEFDTMKFETWEVVEPILRANGGWAWFIGTPKGKKHLHRFFSKGQENHKEWKSWLLKASISGVIPADQLAESKASMSQATFNQEWECEFLEGEGAVFRHVRDICTATPRKPIDGHYYVMGVDLAKVTDWTVITVYDRQTNQQVYQDRFQTLEWPFQKKRIASISSLYNKALIILDSTGLGDPIADDLSRAGIPVEAFKFTESSKKEIIEKLSIWIEQKQLRMLPVSETLTEFDNFSYELGPTGKVRYGAPDGFHDDIVIAHALAVHGLNPLFREKKVDQPKTLIQKMYREAINDNGQNEYNRELAEWSG